MNPTEFNRSGIIHVLHDMSLLLLQSGLSPQEMFIAAHALSNSYYKSATIGKSEEHIKGVELHNDYANGIAEYMLGTQK